MVLGNISPFLERVGELADDAAAATAGPSLDSKYSVVEEDTPPLLRAALVASLIFRDHDPRE